jgi:fido (protein-threonine AMPylation protein)
MAFDPEYGQTLASDEELASLTDAARGAFGDHVRKADLYDAEQAIWADVAQAKMAAVLDGSLAVGDIFTDRFVRGLHADLYGAIWTWAGRYRLRETNIGSRQGRSPLTCVLSSSPCTGDGRTQHS